MRRFPFLIVPVAFLLAAVACSSDDDDVNSDASGKPTVVVTTSILGDIVDNLTDGAVEVTVLVPAGADPHQFQLSARQVAEVAEADALVANGGNLEIGLIDVIESAGSDGIPVINALDGVAPLGDGHGHETDDDHGVDEDRDHDHDDDDDGDAGDHDHDAPDHDDHDHDDHDAHDHDDEHDQDGHDHDDEHDDEHDDDGHDHDGHDHGGVDPHFFTDPGRMADAVDYIAEQLVASIESIDSDVLTTAKAYAQMLRDLADEVGEVLAPIDNRVLVTNHDVLAYFAEAYDFEVVGTVIPTGSTADAASAAALADLAKVLEAEGVAAVFVDATASTGLAETLADEVDGVEIVELYTESLGESGSEGATYVEMIRANAERIAAALG